MEKIAIRFFGLPNTGKSTTMNQIAKDFDSVKIIDTDDIDDLESANKYLLKQLENCTEKIVLFDFIFDVKNVEETNKLFSGSNKIIIDCMFANSTEKIHYDSLSKKNKMLVNNFGLDVLGDDGYVEIPVFNFSEIEKYKLNDLNLISQNNEQEYFHFFKSYDAIKQTITDLLNMNKVDVNISIQREIGALLQDMALNYEKF